MTSDDVQQALVKTFAALQQIQRAEDHGDQLDTSIFSKREAPESASPLPLTARDSIQNDKVVCLECGSEMRQLTALHLKSHNLSPRDYKQKWGFPFGQSLSALSLSKARSKAAKKRGLPQRLVEYLERKRSEKSQPVEVEPTPARAQDMAPEAATEKRPVTKRRRKAEVA
jgi:predicted transcriptional regulator